ncbi:MULTISPECIES: NADPH-dependent F420 reductase [Mameliella]|uniref:NADPH-dependent F420 reductase n=1 Tax=Mameliella TaxID=1434019 RepID=UPI0017EF19CD|nr:MULTISPECIES: NAD(P)-binding domain-containing protein [Mameliella]MCR9275630.1 NAD(P)-binding domain-containing protein [Paracoccaceae bacterium]
MKIAILGSGLMGAALGPVWARAGHAVTFRYARSADKLARLADETGGAHAPVSQAVQQAEAILLAVHWSRVDDVLSQAGDLAGKLVLNCCVPLTRPTRPLFLAPTPLAPGNWRGCARRPAGSVDSTRHRRKASRRSLHARDRPPPRTC